MLRLAKAWLAASIITYVLGTIAMTQVVLFELASVGVSVPLADRAAMTLFDIGGMAFSYLPLVAVALGLGFFVADRLATRRPAWRRWLCLAAAASAILVLIILVQMTLGVNPLSGARTATGVLLQLAAGVTGGLTFSRMTSARATLA